MHPVLPTSPKPGTLVLFQPPPQAYSLSSKQHQCRGQAGVLYRADNDSFAYVLFAHDLLLVNTAYLQLCESPLKPSPTCY